MQSNYDYWLERLAELRMSDRHNEVTDSVLQIVQMHSDALDIVERRIEELFGKLTESYTPEQAYKILNGTVSNDTYDELMKVYQTATDPETKKRALNALNAQALKGRITREEALRQIIETEMLKVADGEIAIMREGLSNTYVKQFQESVRHNGGFGVGTVSQSRIEAVLTAEWSGKNFSQRVWSNTDRIAEMLHETVLAGMQAGESIHKTSRKFDDLVMMGDRASERLLRTETTYIIAEADKASAEARGVKQMQYVGVLDSRTSEKCRDLDGQIIETDKLEVGLNQPPLHPYCRSKLIEVHDGLQHTVRTARDPETGKTYTVPAGMNDREWEGLLKATR